MTERTLISGGLVVDGTGRPGQIGDVLVDDGVIVGVGRWPDGHLEAQSVDAAGMVVAPGFIDLHTHADYSILAFPDAASALRQGVTTVAVGNCGGGIAPIGDSHDIRPVAFAYQPEWGVETDWRTFPEYIDRLGGLGVNVAAIVPHGALRNSVLGINARPATSAELDAMAAALDDALDAGAVGMSTGLQYRPGCWAPASEIRRLVEIVGSHGRMYATHMRDRSERYADAIRESLEAVYDTDAHLQLSHVAPRPNARHPVIVEAYELMAAVSASGRRFGVDTFPEPWGPGLLVDLFPSELMDGDTSQVLARLRDSSVRAEMEAHIDAGSSFLARVAGYDDIYLSWVPERPDLVGACLGTVADPSQGLGAFCCDVLLEAGERLRQVGIRHIYADEAALRDVLAFGFCSVASDGIVTSGEDAAAPLLWSASTYGFTARLFEHYVRGAPLLSLEEAVRRLTSLPASALGLADRGTLAVGARADLVVFDPSRIHDRSSPEEMARHPAGISAVIVNGSIAVDSEGLTGVRAGRLAT
ncbi:MAG TPA: amidohydrolase family protein [Acidimicrobiia bacterium]|nr:amidohydrolase family protein [Acidimicrobiia bacterium]